MSSCSPDTEEELEKLIQRHAAAYVARGGAISNKINAECKAAREALLAALSTGVAQSTVPDRASPAFGYALRLLKHFVAEHFPHNPDWKPCDDLMGVLTQLDNAMTIARDYKEKLRAYEGSPVSSTHETTAGALEVWPGGLDTSRASPDYLAQLNASLLASSGQTMDEAAANNFGLTEEDLDEEDE